jgi:histone-lysine N-methyltransferase SETD2
MGEVLDAAEYARRRRRYGKDCNHTHHYFMALRNGAVIDATVKGNLSRFLNHSCDANLETQKVERGALREEAMMIVSF